MEVMERRGHPLRFCSAQQIHLGFLLLLHVVLCQCWPFNDDGSLLNNEGLALLAFKGSIYRDPYQALSNWNPYDNNPCVWHGISCENGRVVSLELVELSLEGTLVPEISQLIHVKKIVLCKNRFTGFIPKEYGLLQNLEILNLAHNLLVGRIPLEIRNISSLQSLTLSNNKLEGNIPSELGKLKSLAELLLDKNRFSGILPGSSLKNGQIYKSASLCDLQHLRKADFSSNFLEGKIPQCLEYLPRSTFRRNCFDNQMLNHPFQLRCGLYGNKFLFSQEDHIEGSMNARILASESNLQANSPSVFPPVSSPVPSFSPRLSPWPMASSSPSPVSSPSWQLPAPAPAEPPITDDLNFQPSPMAHPSPSPAPSTSSVQVAGHNSPTPVSASEKSTHSKKALKYVYATIGSIMGLILLCLCIVMLTHYKRKLSTIKPWRSGLSGQLQKALITGAPKLNRIELEAACEEFSNVVFSSYYGMAYKGTLSNGVEIAVTSTVISSAENWTPHAELCFRKKIELLSKLNHKNFVNLLGYCVEDVPFTRMMVFEYAPNGTLYEHLYVKEAEHLDWAARMRIIMGIAYCLQYMHHEKESPICHLNINSKAVYLTDDFAAKLADVDVWAVVGREIEREKYVGKSDNNITSKDKPTSELTDVKNNIYSFGLLLIEIISGKLPNAEEDDSYISWAMGYLRDRDTMKYIVDPSLNSFKENELEKICEVIKQCVVTDPLQRISMREIVSSLRQTLPISPDGACPKLSPLWWAELEILSQDGS